MDTQTPTETNSPSSPTTNSSNTPPSSTDSSRNEALRRRIAFRREQFRRLSRRKLDFYAPYPKQLEFHAGGAIHRERWLDAGNQCGKTTCGAAEAAFHLTGRYPPWWPGRRFNKPVRGWVGSDGFLQARDAAQRALVGPPEDQSQWGTGMIPGKDLLGWKRASAGVPNLLDHVAVQHHRNIGTIAEPRWQKDRVSTLGIKSFDQGRPKWQGVTLDFVWMDEEPPYDVYLEALTRTNATGGIAWLTFTPLKGYTELVQSFIDECGLPD
jgi:phage terminase large subunit-like protein